MASEIAAIRTDKAPGAVGPYSQAVKAGDYLYTSGQIALDPATGKLVDGGIREQTAQALTNLENVLKAAGAGLDRVVRCDVFITDIGAFGQVNEVYASRFTSDPKPSRQVLEASALPLGSMVEISCVAYLG